MSNGRIITIVGAAGGLATISIDTAGTVADSTTLATLGITAEERAALASAFAVGQSLWRMPVMHFSPMDGNYPFGAPDGSTPPALTQPDNDDHCPGTADGSIIECTTQVLGEQLPVVGAPFELTYRSNRTRGYKAAFRRTIRLTGDSLPPNLQRVELQIEVAGRTFTQSFEPATNLTTVFA